MAEYEYVARSFNEDDPLFVYSYAPLVGSATPLDTADGDVSYIETTDVGQNSSTTRATFRWSGPTPPPQATWTRAVAQIGWRRLTGSGQSRLTYVDANGARSVPFGEQYSGIPDVASVDGYLIQSALLELRQSAPGEWPVVEPDWPDPFGPDSYVVIDASGTFGSSSSHRVTFARLIITAPGDLPLRQRQRDDGLGMSTARWSRGSSRQSSNRWRGYL